MAVGKWSDHYFKYLGSHSRRYLWNTTVSALVTTEKKRIGKVPYSASLFFARRDSHNILKQPQVLPTRPSSCSSTEPGLAGDDGFPHFGPSLGEASGTLPTQLIPCVGPLWNMKVLCKTLRAWHPRESGTMSEEQWDYFRGTVGTVPRLAWQGMLGEGWCDFAQTGSRAGIHPPSHEL